LTHQTSPRRIRFPFIVSAANTVRDKSLAPFPHFGIQRGVLLDLKSDAVQRVVLFGQSLFQQASHKRAPLPGGNRLLEAFSKPIGDMKKQLHTFSPFVNININIHAEQKSQHRAGITTEHPYVRGNARDISPSTACLLFLNWVIEQTVWLVADFQKCKPSVSNGRHERASEENFPSLEKEIPILSAKPNRKGARSLYSAAFFLQSF
jgi:hypothetical protein